MQATCRTKCERRRSLTPPGIGPPGKGSRDQSLDARRSRYWINTEDEAREAVRELATLNVDLVKVWVDDRNGQYEKLTPELYTAVIDEAHQHGLRVTAHVFTLEDAKGLLNGGCRRLCSRHQGPGRRR